MILEKSSSLYKSYRMRRVYYSAFSPIPRRDSRLPLIAAPLAREHRLYEADWLLRFYGYTVGELTTPEEPNLSLENDPKLSWALRNRSFFLVDVNLAPEEALLRVPGLGVRSVRKIIKIRRFHKFRLEDLGRLRAAVARLKFFVITSDSNPSIWQLDSQSLPQLVKSPSPQLSLFQTGEL